MEPLIAQAARALSAGDPLSALNRVALRDDPPALALRGIAMAQLGDLARAKALLRRAARAFGPEEAVARARCRLAEAEIAFVCRELGGPMASLAAARSVLESRGDAANAAHAGYLQARLLLLIGRLGEARELLDTVDAERLPPASLVGYWLVLAGIAMRRLRARPARDALDRAERAARALRIPPLQAEVAAAIGQFEAPAARRVAGGEPRLLGLAEVEALMASDTFLVDACRHVVRRGAVAVSLSRRPVLFALARALAEAWPDDAPRETLLARAFRAREADETHRARLRVEIGRLRAAIRPLAGLAATRRGFVLKPHGGAMAAVLAPPVEGAHADLLALLADGEAWSSSALALALDVSPRTVQRALETLSEGGRVEAFGHGRARRWRAAGLPGFPTSLLLPAPAILG